VNSRGGGQAGIHVPRDAMRRVARGRLAEAGTARWLATA
jgi:hypothetical protein